LEKDRETGRECRYVPQDKWTVHRHLEHGVWSWTAISKRVRWKWKDAEKGWSKDAQCLPCFSEWDASTWKRANEGKIYKSQVAGTKRVRINCLHSDRQGSRHQVPKIESLQFLMQMVIDLW